jgi:hydroxyacylglutathione hydrolase
MLFERIESTGLAHYSYLLGARGEAVVIDPRRDVEEYVRRAQKQGLRITHILETHRNEDYVVGSVALAERTGAHIWHADAQLPYEYGEGVHDEQVWNIGGLRLEAIHTPGHTPGSMSYLLHDLTGAPWMVFCGDVLFAGEVGRVDLPDPARIEEAAAELHQSIFERILPLGDELLLCPAHGSGSACGSSIVDRPWTTLGMERRHNPRLAHTKKDDFVAHVARVLERPPYFRRMERINLIGAAGAETVSLAAPLQAEEMAEAMRESWVLDVRPSLAFAAGHIPGALSIWPGGVSSFAGWFLDNERPLLLVTTADEAVASTQTELLRMGFDRLSGYLAGGMHSWLTDGLYVERLPTMTVHELCRHLDDGQTPYILDVRSDEEIATDGAIPGAQHIHITQVPERSDEIPDDREVLVFCGTGLRSTTVASYLQYLGGYSVNVLLGGLAGWDSVSCPLEMASK